MSDPKSDDQTKPALYEPQDLASVIEALAAECRALKKEVADLEKAKQSSEALVAENAQLKRETRELQIQFVRVVAQGGRAGEKRHAARLLEVYKKDVEELRKPKKDSGGKPAA
jgi:hypothetical protein